MKLAIVILNWNGLSMMSRFLPTVLEYSRDEAEIYVADNASTDGSVDWLKQHYPDVHIILLDRNYGFAEGYNRALKQIEAEYYLLLNSDVEVTHHWLTPLLEFMDSHDDVAACQPKLLSEINKDSFEYAGAAGGFIDKLGYPFCRGRIFDTIETDDGQYDSQEEIMWATGACLMVRSADYWQAGGLDNRFFAHNEEIDLCWRMHLAGRRIFCVTDSEVYHVGGGTLPKGNPMKTYLNFRNNLTMLYKNLPAESLRRVMRLRWLLDYVAAWQTLICKGNIGDFKAIYRARHDFHRWKHQFDADRRKSLSLHKEHPNALPLKPYSILWQYYVHGRRLYSEMPDQLSDDD